MPAQTGDERRYPRDVHKNFETRRLSPDADRAIKIEKAIPDKSDPAVVQKEHDATLEFLQKVFIILQEGLQFYKGSAYENFDQDVARALAHGGRVNIRIPKINESDNVFNLTN